MIKMKERSALGFWRIYFLIIVPFTLIWVGLGILGTSIFEGYFVEHFVEYILGWVDLLIMVLIITSVVLCHKYFK